MKLKHIAICLLACFIPLSFASNPNILLPLQEVQKLNMEKKKAEEVKYAKKHGKNLKGSSNAVKVYQKFVPLSAQRYTPFSVNTRMLMKKGGSNGIQKGLKADTSCLSLVQQSSGNNYNISVNSNQWWSTGTITFGIQNTCNSPQELNNVVVALGNLQMNGASVPQSDIGINSQTGSPYLTTSVVAGSTAQINLSSPSCSGQYCSWAELQPNAVVTINVGITYGGLISNITIGSVSIMGATPPAPTPAPGQLNVNVNSQSLQSFCLSTQNCAIQMNLLDPSGNIIESGIVNPAVNPTVQQQYQNLLPGNYTMVVVPSTLPTPPQGAMINYTYAPSANITVNSNTVSTGTIQFVYTPATPTGSVLINLANVSQSSTFANIGLISGQLIDQTTQNVLPFQIGLGGFASVSNLVIGHSYAMQIQGISDPSTAVFYSPVNQSFTVSSASQIVKNITYTATPSSNLIAVNFTESVNNGGIIPSTPLSLQFGSNNNYYKYNVDSFINSATMTLDKNDTIAVTVSAPKGYSLSSTNPFVINTSTSTIPTQAIVLQSVSNSSLLVGYLSNSYGIGQSVYTEISQAAQAGYNVVVIAFAMLQNTTPMTWYGDQFLAYTSWQTFGTCPTAINTVIQDIATAKQYYGLKYVLASVGGANSTFDISQVSTSSQIQTMAQNIVNFINQYGLDGIDFDIEAPMNGTTFAQLLVAIKAINPNIIISAPPQANSVGSSTTDVAFVTTGTDQDYNPAIIQGSFDYLWLQAYNTGNTSNQIMYNGQLTDETMAEYIPASYYYFTGQLSAKPPVTVPSSTRFIIGEPSQVDAGGLATVWHNPNYATTGDVYQALAQNYNTVLAQSNGAMTWSINQDIDIGCQFASNVGKVLGITTIVCPTNGDTYHGTLNPNNC